MLGCPLVRTVKKGGPRRTYGREDERGDHGETPSSSQGGCQSTGSYTRKGRIRGGGRWAETGEVINIIEGGVPFTTMMPPPPSLLPTSKYHQPHGSSGVSSQVPGRWETSHVRGVQSVRQQSVGWAYSDGSLLLMVTGDHNELGQKGTITRGQCVIRK